MEEYFETEIDLSEEVCVPVTVEYTMDLDFIVEISEIIKNENGVDVMDQLHEDEINNLSEKISLEVQNNIGHDIAEAEFQNEQDNFLY